MCSHKLCYGPCKEKNPNIREYYGSGCVGPGLTQNFFRGKSSQNSPKPVGIFWSSIPCVFYLYICIAKSCWLLWFECSVHMSVMDFQKKTGWMENGWGELYPIFLGFLNFVNFGKPLSLITCHLRLASKYTPVVILALRPNGFIHVLNETYHRASRLCVNERFSPTSMTCSFIGWAALLLRYVRRSIQHTRWHYVLKPDTEWSDYIPYVQREKAKVVWTGLGEECGFTTTR